MIKVEHITKSFGNLKALDDVSLEVKKGEIICLIGPSGSGKGTIAKEVAKRLGYTYVDTGAAWAWPTNSPYTITSHYGYRWGTLHDGMDISGTGYGSPIYAVLDGEVYQSQWGGVVGNSAGYNVVIKHANGYYTVYAHCSKLYVKKGQKVTRRQKIAAMGASGTVTGTHLHFGVFTGVPYNGGKSIDPRKLWS